MGEDQRAVTDFKRSMGIRAVRPDEVVLAGKMSRAPVESRPQAAGVEGFEGVDVRENGQQGFEFPVPFANFVEGMRNADQGALFSQAGDRLQGSQAGGNLFADVHGQEFPLGCIDLLTDDNPLGIEFLGV